MFVFAPFGRYSVCTSHVSNILSLLFFETSSKSLSTCVSPFAPFAGGPFALVRPWWLTGSRGLQPQAGLHRGPPLSLNPPGRYVYYVASLPSLSILRRAAPRRAATSAVNTASAPWVTRCFTLAPAPFQRTSHHVEEPRPRVGSCPFLPPRSTRRACMFGPGSSNVRVS